MNRYTFTVEYFFTPRGKRVRLPFISALTYQSALLKVYADYRIQSALLINITLPNRATLSSQSELFNPSTYDIRSL